MTGTDLPGGLWRNDLLAGTPSAPQPLRDALAWAERYLAQPHPDLGRPGAVCPFVQPALDERAVWFAEADLAGGSEAAVDECLLRYAELFDSLPPLGPQARQRKAVVVVFGAVPPQQALRLLSGALSRTKPAFVARGLMLGPVHPAADAPGAHNPAFRPMRGPVPLVAIRALLESDLVFLDRPGDDRERRAAYLSSYLDQLAPRLSAARRRKAEQALAALGGSHPHTGEAGR
jgi:hypothetical protein